MASTGEVGCFGDDLHEAFFKAMLSTGFEVPHKNILISIGKIEDKADFLPAARKLAALGFTLFATPGTAKVLADGDLAVTEVHKMDSDLHPTFAELIQKDKVDWVINIPRGYSHEEMTLGYTIRRLTIDNNIPLTTDMKVAKLMVDTLEHYKVEDLAIEPWSSYI